jgi:peptidoglycan hydrolase-like protein with peptidoglycan-binding domain
MKIKTWGCHLGVALLLLGAAPLMVSAAKPATAQSSKSKKSSKKRTSSRKSSRKAKPAGQKAPAPDRIREIQSALQREGAMDGEPTGKWDDATIDGMKKYQEKQGLNPTGKIDAPTLNKLGLGAETAGKGAPTVTSSNPKPVSAP